MKRAINNMQLKSEKNVYKLQHSQTKLNPVSTGYSRSDFMVQRELFFLHQLMDAAETLISLTHVYLNVWMSRSRNKFDVRLLREHFNPFYKEFILLPIVWARSFKPDANKIDKQNYNNYYNKKIN